MSSSLLALTILFVAVTLLLLAGLGIYLWRWVVRRGGADSQPTHTARKEQ